MEEVQPNDLVVGEDYYIQMFGPHVNQYMESGKAIGVHFIGLTTWGALLNSPDYRNMEFGISPDDFDDDNLMVQFQQVQPVGARACGICHIAYYRADPAFARGVGGGFKFFKMRKKEIKDRMKHEALHKLMNQHKKLEDMEHLGPKAHVHSYLSGGKTRRKPRRRKRRKTRKTRKTRRKTRRKRRRKRNTRRKK